MPLCGETITDFMSNYSDMLSELRGHVTGYWRTHALRFALNLGLFDLLAARPGISTKMISSHTSIDTSAASHLLCFLQTIGLINETRNRWYLTDSSRALLVQSSDSYLGDWLLNLSSLSCLESWRAFSDGADNSDKFSHITDDGARASARAQIARHLADILFDFLEKQNWFFSVGSFIDLGCGTGGYLRIVQQAKPHIQVIAVDLNLRSILALRQSLPAVLPIVADFRRLPVVGLADVVLLSNILHEFDDPTCVELLTNCRKLLRPSGHLVLHHDNAKHDIQFTALGSLHLFCSTAKGFLRSAVTINQLCGRAGLAIITTAELGIMRVDIAIVR
jgi:SAM-dependent methyltransferase